MFSGIITDLGKVTAITEGIASRVLSISVLELDFWSDVHLGDSIAVMGCCLTVVEHSASEAVFDVSAETLRCTILGNLVLGDVVHLEKSLRLADRLHGHFVLGHIDGVATVIERSLEGNAIRVCFKVPTSLMKYIVRKGAVALNGVSLTVNEVKEDRFSVMIIPHTQFKTMLQTLECTQQVNIEIDMLARYIEKLI
jgi:riboflavin synthase